VVSTWLYNKLHSFFGSIMSRPPDDSLHNTHWWIHRLRLGVETSTGGGAESRKYDTFEWAMVIVYNPFRLFLRARVTGQSRLKMSFLDID
jgi:hypothetical protein